MRADRPKTKRSRLGREDFLARSLEILSKDGESKLRIDRLVKALGVTKGSFYWHFENRSDFVVGLAEYWHRYTNERVFEELAKVDDGPKAQLIKIHELVTRYDLPKYDLVMRSWATHEPDVAKIVRSVDRERFEVVSGLFRRLGFEGEDLDIRTRTFIVTTSLWPAITQRESKKIRLQHLAAVLELLTAPIER